MASGGARGRSGPPPERNAIRNGRAGADWIRLPATGRKGDPPAFPLPRSTKRERDIWAEEWRRPQAIMWEANGQALEVALYVRTLREAEIVKAPASLRTLLVRMQEHLGLSQPGLARNHWIIDTDPVEPPAAGETDAPAPIRFADARDRLRQVTNAG
jgi:hypothetical protein